MEDQGNEGSSKKHGHGSERSEEGVGVVGVRSRWSPKAEQILILESIFNSGMVNPPKHETVRIRKLLEKFGAVADANVFYWFQNRRSRSRRRHRQMLLAQANLHRPHPHPPPHQPHDDQLMGFASASASASMDFGASSSSSSSYQASQQPLDPLYPLLSPDHAGFPKIDHTSPPTSLLYPPLPHLDDVSNFNYPSGYITITVFINGVVTEVPRGPIDIKTMFGQDVMLVHSSGVPLPTNEFGFLMQDLQQGESYFLVSNPT